MTRMAQPMKNTELVGMTRTMYRRGVLVAGLAIFLTAGCAREAKDADTGRATDSPPADSTPSAETAVQAAGTDEEGQCAAPAGGVRVAHDTVAGLPTHAPLSTLIAVCGEGETDLVSFGGSQSPARLFRFPGAEVRAGQTKFDYGDSLDLSLAADLWQVEGDSVRLPDGGLLPQRVGELEARYGAAVVMSDKRDDSDGVRVRLCRYPDVELVLEYSEPTPDDVGAWLVGHGILSDTARIYSLEVSNSNRPESVVRLCGTTHRPEDSLHVVRR